MRQTACALAFALAGAAAASAQDAPSAVEPEAETTAFDVRQAINGVWALDPREVEDPGEFTCDGAPLVLQVTHDGRGIASLRAGEEEFTQGAIVDVRNDFPAGPAMTILWEDAPKREDGEFETLIVFMPDPNTFSYVRSSDMIRSRDTGEPLPVVPHARCAQAPPDAEPGVGAAEDAPTEGAPNEE
jgi:hypothetical protein